MCFFFHIYTVAQNLSIIVGDYEGNVIGCLPHCTQWRLRLNDMTKTANKVCTCEKRKSLKFF